MIKGNKQKLIISSVLILCPIIAGLILWGRLPDTIATHWGVNNQANGWSSKAFAVFGVPLFLELLHWICLIGTSLDKKNNDHNKKMLNMFYWFCPVMSIFVCSVIYASALDIQLAINDLVFGLLGIMFIVIGNYIPKVTQNRTLGIKIKWTLENEENWNATHRIAGKCWFICGLLTLLNIFVPSEVSVWTFIAITLTAVLVPCIYSYWFYKKSLK